MNLTQPTNLGLGPKHDKVPSHLMHNSEVGQFQENSSPRTTYPGPAILLNFFIKRLHDCIETGSRAKNNSSIWSLQNQVPTCHQNLPGSRCNSITKIKPKKKKKKKTETNQLSVGEKIHIPQETLLCLSYRKSWSMGLQILIQVGKNNNNSTECS